MERKQLGLDPVRKIVPSEASLNMAFEMKALTMGLKGLEKTLTKCRNAGERSASKGTHRPSCFCFSLV